MPEETEVKEAPTEKPKRGEQKSLPGMQDREIEALQKGARRYAAIRDQRMALTEKEVELRDELLGMMKQRHKIHYLYEGVEITVVAEREKVKVRIHKDED